MKQAIPVGIARCGERHWRLVRGDRDAQGGIPRGGVVRLSWRSDGQWEWRWRSHWFVGRSFDDALADLVRAWLDAVPPVPASEPMCLWCPTELLVAKRPGRGRPSVFCGTSCRVAAHRAVARVEVDALFPRMRRRGTSASDLALNLRIAAIGRIMWRNSGGIGLIQPLSALQ